MASSALEAEGDSLICWLLSRADEVILWLGDDSVWCSVSWPPFGCGGANVLAVAPAAPLRTSMVRLLLARVDRGDCWCCCCCCCSVWDEELADDDDDEEDEDDELVRIDEDEKLPESSLTFTRLVTVCEDEAGGLMMSRLLVCSLLFLGEMRHGFL